MNLPVRLTGLFFENSKDLYKILDVEIIGTLSDYSRPDIKVTGEFWRYSN